MSIPHRIAAGGITFHNNTILLVRYHNPDGGTYLVAPGGELEETENIIDAIIRETKEETAITVLPKKVVAIEDLLCSQFKCAKTWMVCEYIKGVIDKTSEAKIEGIIDTAWFTRDQLEDEIVYPELILEYQWHHIQSDSFPVVCPKTRKTNF